MATTSLVAIIDSHSFGISHLAFSLQCMQKYILYCTKYGYFSVVAMQPCFHGNAGYPGCGPYPKSTGVSMATTMATGILLSRFAVFPWKSAEISWTIWVIMDPEYCHSLLGDVAAWKPLSCLHVVCGKLVMGGWVSADVLDTVCRTNQELALWPCAVHFPKLH